MSKQPHESTGATEKITVGAVLSWVFGVLFLFLGLLTLIMWPYFFGLILIIISLLIIPHSSNWLKNRFNLKLNNLTKLGVAILACFIFIAAIGVGATHTVSTLDIATNYTSTTASNPDQSVKVTTAAPEKDYVIINGKKPTLQELHTFMFEGRLTELQQKTFFKQQLKNKYIVWDAYVKTIDDGGGYPLLAIKNPPTGYEIMADVGVSVQATERAKLVRFYEGDRIKFEGKLVSYGNIISSDIFYVEDAIILS